MLSRKGSLCVCLTNPVGGSQCFGVRSEPACKHLPCNDREDDLPEDEDQHENNGSRDLVVVHEVSIKKGQ